MTLEAIINQVQSLPIKEIRKATADYCEIVLANEQVDACQGILEAALGPPVKQAGEVVTEDLLALTEDFGEIVDHQILYVEKGTENAIVAMLWPWRDDVHTTLVMGFHQ